MTVMGAKLLLIYISLVHLVNGDGTPLKFGKQRIDIHEHETFRWDLSEARGCASHRCLQLLHRMGATLSARVVWFVRAGGEAHRAGRSLRSAHKKLAIFGISLRLLTFSLQALRERASGRVVWTGGS